MYILKLTELEKEALLGAMWTALDEGLFPDNVNFNDLESKIENSKDEN